MDDMRPDGLIERDAQLFEAGDYPDKGVNVTEADLDLMVANHPTEGVDLKIEHGDTPFDGFLGRVKTIWRDGLRLLGKIEMPAPAWALADYAGAKKLSVGIKPDKSGLAEVSLVKFPRVATAQMFAFDAGDFIDEIPLRNGVEYGQMMAHLFAFAAHLGGTIQTPKEVTSHMADPITPTPPETPAVDVKEFEALKTEREADKKRIADLEFSNRQASAKSQVDVLVREGKIAPASVEFAVGILAHASQTIQFAGTETSISDLFGKFMAAQGAIITFGESGKVDDKGEPTTNFSDDEIEGAFKLHPEFKGDREKAVEFLKIGNS